MRLPCRRHRLGIDAAPVTRLCPICLGEQLAEAGWATRLLPAERLRDEYGLEPPPGSRLSYDNEPDHVGIFGAVGPSQAELFGAPISGTYGGDREHRGRRPRMPQWYSTLCDGWSRAAWRGEITWEHAAMCVAVWHPLALEQALIPGAKRRPNKERELELELFAGLLAAGVDEPTARHLVGLDNESTPKGTSDDETT